MKDVRPYPLSWPELHPRTPAGERADSKFGKMTPDRRSNGTLSDHKTKTKRSFANARDALIAELGRVTANTDRDNFVLSTNVRLRLDGEPSGNAGTPEDPGVAVYFIRRLPSGAPKQYVMSTDIYKRVADNCYALAVTIEAMRKIERHGSSQLMEQAFSGFAALPPAGKRPWHYVLGIDESWHGKPAPEVARHVNHKYREIVASKHSDRSDDHESAAELNDARDRARANLELLGEDGVWSP